jgi:metallophosphoesterase (TIGR03767 family)
MRRTMTLLVAGAAVCCLAAPAAQARPQTTVVQTIEDRDGDRRLERGPGEDHVVREELAPALPGRDRRRASRIFFAQMTDTHVIDEESPLRVEFLDRFGGPFTSAYRPQEGLSAQVLDQMVEQLRNTRSPVTQKPIELVMTTGDNTDNTQLNETRWMIDVMGGAREVDPDSGLAGPCGPKGYHGVRGGREYYEPDSSEGEDGRGYSPRPEENGREVVVRDFPGLFDRMNQPFNPVGFGDIPWYAVFGNHDGLVQGNQPRHAALDEIAVGCVKVTGLPTELAEQISEQARQGDGSRGLKLLQQAVVAAAEEGDSGSTKIVPPDPARRPLRKNEWIAEHLDTPGHPAGHGFGPDNVASGMGNYSFSPKPGLRFIALDTVAEHGLEQGNIDDDQFRWLHAELLKAGAAKEAVMVFAHHSLQSMGQPPVSPFVPPGDTGGNLSPLVHYGEGPRNSEAVLPCKTFTPEAPTTPDETLRCLLLRHPSVVAFVNGHEHNHRVDPVEGLPPQNGFWEINTASHIDWPQHSRVLDLVDNRDGTLSIFGTVVDHAAPADPGGSPADRSTGEAGQTVARLASIARELTFNDHQKSHNPRGDGGGRGSREDRNVELLIRNPHAAG